MKNKKDNTVLNLKLKIVLSFFFSFLTVCIIILVVVAIILRFILADKTINHISLLLVSLLFVLITGTLLGYIITRKQFRVVSEIKNVIKEVSNGNFDIRFESKVPNGILENIKQDFNKMIDDLKYNSVLKSDFALQFSHEFKTPIVSIKGYAELLKDILNSNSDLDKDSLIKYLDIIINESQRLSALANSTLLMSNVDNNYILKRTEYSLTNQIEECVLLLDNDLKLKSIKTNIDIDNVDVFCEKDLMKEVILNLLTNAIKFSKDNSTIEIFLKKHDDEVKLSVRDSGIGINNNDIRYIFDKYYQADNTYQNKGIGLGLYITKKIIDIHKGKIEVKSIKDYGTIFEIVLPISN
ncbi:MAG: ATP-binding protein [Anaeroplasmataceae bacterium]